MKRFSENPMELLRADTMPRVLDHLAAAKLEAGPGIRVRRTGRYGQVVDDVSRAGVWAHPWQTRASWDAEAGWVATVREGLVNAQSPVASGAVLSVAPLALGTQTLDKAPRIALRSLRSGLEGEGPVVKRFFRELGVREEKAEFVISETGGVTLPDVLEEEPELPPRLLAAVDLYIAVARPAFAASITPVDASGTSGVVVDYAVRYDTRTLDLRGSAPRLLATSRFQPVRQPTLAERLLGLYTDEGEDRRLISTVFLLSPPEAENPTPGPDWTAFVQHHTQWNLRWEPRNAMPPRPPAPLRLVTGLAFGLGDAIGNQILSGVNDFSARVLNAVNTTTTEGRFSLA